MREDLKGAIETVEHEELVNVKAENEALQAKLTKRNEQYMMGLDKALTPQLTCLRNAKQKFTAKCCHI